MAPRPTSGIRTLLLGAILGALALGTTACGDDDSPSEVSAASSRACDHLVECVQNDVDTQVNLDRDLICSGFDQSLEVINVVSGSCRSAVLNYYDCVENTPCATIVGDDDFCETESNTVQEVCDTQGEDDPNEDPFPGGGGELSAAAQAACENAAECNDVEPNEASCSIFEGYIDFASFFGPACTGAVEDYLICVANASCSELDGDSCDAAEAAVDDVCMVSTN